MEPTMPQACGEIDRLRNRADWVEPLQRTNHRLYEQCQERLADKDAKIADLTGERDHLREAFETALNLQDRAIRERVSVTQARAEADHARDIALWLVAEARAERDRERHLRMRTAWYRSPWLSDALTNAEFGNRIETLTAERDKASAADRAKPHKTKNKNGEH
jgi:phosphate starvation-inducible protein PhoH